MKSLTPGGRRRAVGPMLPANSDQPLNIPWGFARLRKRARSRGPTDLSVNFSKFELLGDHDNVVLAKLLDQAVEVWAFYRHACDILLEDPPCPSLAQRIALSIPR